MADKKTEVDEMVAKKAEENRLTKEKAKKETAKRTAEKRIEEEMLAKEAEEEAKRDKGEKAKKAEEEMLAKEAESSIPTEEIKKADIVETESITPETLERAKKNFVIKITGIGVDQLDKDCFNIAESVANFMNNTNPEKNITATDGAKAQTGLFRNLNKILKLDNRHFEIIFDWLIDVVRVSRNKGNAFDDKYVMRYHSNMNISTKELRIFRMLVNLICVTADLRNKRNVASKIDISKIINSLENQTAKNNIISYYSF